MILAAVKDFAVLALVPLIVGKRHRVERRLQLPALKEADERRHGAVALLDPRDGRKGITHDPLLLGGHVNALLAQVVTEPVECPLPLILIVNVGERLEGQRTRSPNVVKFAADTHGEDFARCALVEDDDARILVFTECRLDAVEMDGLSCARRTDHQRVPHILDVEIQPIRRATVGLRVEQRRSVQVFVALVACPGKRERHHVDEISRRDERAANVRADEPRNAAEPSVDGIKVLDLDPLHTALDEDLTNEFRLLLHRLAVLVGDDDRRRVVYEGDVIALHGVHRIPYLGDAVNGDVVDVLCVLYAVTHGDVGEC